MEATAFVGWVVMGVVVVMCLGSRLRQMMLHAHTESLRDRGEYKYSRVQQQQV